MNLNEFHRRYWELLDYRKEYTPSKIVLNAWEDENTISKTGTYKVINSLLQKYNTPLILDVGAGDKRLKKYIESMGLHFKYKSLDISTNLLHDYNDIMAISESFDVITMFELIEHLPLEVALSYITKAYEILNQNGSIIISTPNIEHINQLWRQDVSHIQQYPTKDIYSILRMIGFSVSIEAYRINLVSRKRSIKSNIKEKLRIFINKILGTDYAHGVMIVAYKND